MTQYELIASIKQKEIYDDRLRPIKGVLTDFVNDHFLKYNDNQLKLFKLIYTVITPILDKYGLKLLFKGGNVLRLINLNIIQFFPKGSEDIINDIFSEYLKQSDNDFTIFIDPNIDNNNEVTFNVSNEVFEGLNKIRFILENKLGYYFDIYNLSNKQINKLFMQLKADINKEKIIDVHSIKVKPIYDKMIVLENPSNYKSNVQVYDIINKRKNEFYNSINYSLEFLTQTKTISKFILLRTKLNFLINNKANIAGELIDISIPNERDKNMQPLNTTKKFNNFMKKNIEVSYNKEYDFTYYTVNIHYMIKDLYKMLFLDMVYAWDNQKYAKRIARLLYFIFLEKMDYKKITLKSLYNIKYDFNNFAKHKKSNIRDLNLILKYINNKNYKKQPKYNEFIQTVQKYSVAILNIIDGMTDYMLGKTRIDKKNVYKLNIV